MGNNTQNTQQLCTNMYMKNFTWSQIIHVTIRKHNILTSLYNVQLFITLIQVKVKFLL